MQAKSTWINEAIWLLAGSLVSGGIVLGFFLILALPFVLIGMTAVVFLSLQRRPGAWMFLTGASGMPSALYVSDFMKGGPCPYSSIVIPGEAGAMHCRYRSLAARGIRSRKWLSTRANTLFSLVESLEAASGIEPE